MYYHAPVCVVLEMEPRAVCMLGKRSTSWAAGTSHAPGFLGPQSTSFTANTDPSHSTGEDMTIANDTTDPLYAIGTGAYNSELMISS